MAAGAPAGGRPAPHKSRLVFGKAGHRAPEKRLVSLSEAHIAAVAAAHIGAPDGVLAGVIAVRTARRSRAAVAGIAAIARGAGAGRAGRGRAFAGARLAGAGRADGRTGAGRAALAAVAAAAAGIAAIAGAVIRRLAAHGKQVGKRPHEGRRASPRSPV